MIQNEAKTKPSEQSEKKYCLARATRSTTAAEMLLTSRNRDEQHFLLTTRSVYGQNDTPE